tara:strand:- start:403 stop:654 length:252 start_codon:yes stop_codon:yes gene_type:complete
MLDPLQEHLIKEEMNAIKTALDNALNNAAKKEKKINAAELSERMNTFCEMILSLPAKEAKSFQPILADMIKALNRLEELLKKR